LKIYPRCLKYDHLVVELELSKFNFVAEKSNIIHGLVVHRKK